MGSGPHFRRGQTSRYGPIARGAGVGRYKGGRAVVGGAEDDGLVGAHRIQIQNCVGAREKKQGTRVGPAASQAGNQCFLGSLIEVLFQHVDDQYGRAFGFQTGKQGKQGIRRHSAIFDEPGKALIHP